MENIACSRRRFSRLAALAAGGFLLSAPAACATARDPAAPAPAIAVDRERGEIHFPCRFVNPSRLLEVFACHASGPTHETVLEFDVTGPEISRALIEIGCRGASYWNGTSRDDFLKNQGDRLLVLVRWKWTGDAYEYPAEGMLTDGETEFPAFIRGFSFGARGAFKVERPEEGAETPREDGGGGGAGKAGEATPGDRAPPAPGEAIPLTVEITLGASLRQSPSASILSHPTSSARLLPWMLPPYLDPRVVKDHQQLVEKQVPAELVIRRVRSETEIVHLARSVALRRGLDDAGALYARILPLAREIDDLKGGYERLLASIRELLAKGGDAGKLTAEEKKLMGERGRELLAEGRWLCARIEERYLSLYALEEEYKAAWVEKRTDLDPEVRDEVLVRVRDGFLYEPLLARKEVERAELDLPRSGGKPGDASLRARILDKERLAIDLRRSRALSLANRRYAESKARALDATDPYLVRLFGEDIRRAEIAVKRYEARERLCQGKIQRLRATLEGRWDAVKDEVLKLRQRARRDLRITDLEEQLLALDEELRWSEGDAASDVPDRKQGAEAKLRELRRKRADLEKRLDEARKAL